MTTTRCLSLFEITDFSVGCMTVNWNVSVTSKPNNQKKQKCYFLVAFVGFVSYTDQLGSFLSQLHAASNSVQLLLSFLLENH